MRPRTAAQAVGKRPGGRPGAQLARSPLPHSKEPAVLPSPFDLKPPLSLARDPGREGGGACPPCLPGVSTPGSGPGPAGVMPRDAFAPGPTAAWRKSGKQLPKASFGPRPLFFLLADLAPMCYLTNKSLAAVPLLRSGALAEVRTNIALGGWPSAQLPPDSPALALVGLSS